MSKAPGTTLPSNPAPFRAVVPYAVVGLIALLLALLIGWFIFSNLPVLSVYEFGTRAYYILLVVLALSASVFLFGVLRSTGKVTGKQFGVTFEFGGAAAVFAFVLLGGVLLLKQEQTDFPLIIRLRTEDGRPPADAFTPTGVSESKVFIDLGPDSRTEPLDHKGEVRLPTVAFRLRYSAISIALSSKAFVFKEPKGAYTIPSGSEPVITLVVVPPPKKVKQQLIRAQKPSGISSGGTSDGHSPWCQPRSTQTCVEPQHGGRLVKGSGGVADLVKNHPTRAGYEIVKDEPAQICVKFFASTAACETQISVQGTVTAVEEYEEP
jgi:hypothetical protein